MANKTVYPYGTGGLLPSSIGIINDLTTGGADKALSAEQGKILKEKFDEAEYDYVAIDISTYKTTRLYISYSFTANGTRYINITNNVWTQSSTSAMFLVPVNPGETYRIVGGAAQGRYAFLKTDNRSSNSTPDYATGASGVNFVNAGETVEVNIPSDCRFLAVNSTLAGNNICPASISLRRDVKPSLSSIQRVPIIYNMKIGSRLDCRVSSADFGKEVAATNADWGTTQYIDLQGIRYVRFLGQEFSGSVNYAGFSGACFYDKNYNALSNGVQLIKSGTAALKWYDVQVPEGARYLKATLVASGQNFSVGAYLYPLDNSDVYGNDPVVVTFNKRYYGERADLDENQYKYATVATNSVSGQSAAIYGKYLFIVKDHLEKVICYDMENKVVLYTLTTGVAYDSTWHCNQSNFGIEKYDSADMFPPLYISQQNNNDGRCVVLVVRIIPTLSNGEITSFTISIVQTIYLPVMTAENCLGNANITFDYDNEVMWAYCRNNGNEANHNIAHFVCFSIPSLFDSTLQPVTEVVLSDTDIIDQFSDYWSMAYAQGGFIRNGKLVIGQGYQSIGRICLRVIDLYAQKKMVSFFNLLADGFTAEPEGVFWFDDAIHIHTNGSSIYKISIK